MALEFSIEKDDLTHALKPFFGRGSSGRHTELDYVDVKAQEGEVEFIRADFISNTKADVTSSGIARFPFALFQTIFGKPQNLAWSTAGRISIRIIDGRIQTGATTFDHPEVSIQTANARIANLPVNASLQDVLSLALRFSEQELRDSGVWERVIAAQDQADQMIGKAVKILGPLNVTGEALRGFVQDQIMKPRERLRL